METCEIVDVYIHIFLTWALVGWQLSASRSCHFIPCTHWKGGWVDPRAGLDAMEKLKLLTLLGLELRLLHRQARSQSLYRQRHRATLLQLYVGGNVELCVGYKTQAFNRRGQFSSYGTCSLRCRQNFTRLAGHLNPVFRETPEGHYLLQLL
jgi:hypothetical protein